MPPGSAVHLPENRRIARRLGGPDPALLDREYRGKAAANVLPRPALRRFNPPGAARLPVLHTRRGARHYRVHCSNAAPPGDAG